MQHDASGLVRTSRLLLVAGTLTALALGCGGSKKDTLQSITVSPSMTTISPNAMTQFMATLNYQGGKGPSVKPAVVWSSSDMNVATIDNNGRALGKAPGMTTITARAGGKMGTATLRVSAMRVLTAIQVTPRIPACPYGGRSL